MRQIQTFICQQCGHVTHKWVGKCPSCGEWNALEENIEVADVTKRNQKPGKKKNNLPLHSLHDEKKDHERYKTGINEFDRVCGGGLVPSGVLLIGGEPGIGKSTLLLQLATKIQNLPDFGKVMYISGEEAVNQIQMRAKRLKVENSPMILVSGSQLEEIITTLNSEKPKLIIIDSIQTLWSDIIPSSPGTISQLRHCTSALTFYAKQNEASLILIGHVTKDGQIAGPKAIEHMVDTVLYFEQSNQDQLRLLRAMKNRYGPAHEIGVFEMEHDGLHTISNPSEIFLAGRNFKASGSAIFAGIQGSRPILMEMQALITPTNFGNPRRAVVGWDNARLSMILAVLEMRADVVFGNQDVYITTAGGIKVSDPAVDLAVAAALISAHFNIALPPEYVFYGEIGLSGAIRNVQNPQIRQEEAKKLAFNKIVKPFSQSKNDKKDQKDLEFFYLKHIDELVQLIRSL